MKIIDRKKTYLNRKNTLHRSKNRLAVISDNRKAEMSDIAGKNSEFEHIRT